MLFILKREKIENLFFVKEYFIHPSFANYMKYVIIKAINLHVRKLLKKRKFFVRTNKLAFIVTLMIEKIV